MSLFNDLLLLPESELAGSLHTAREIDQQPRLWAKVLDLLAEKSAEIGAFLRSAGMNGRKSSTVLLCGAGSSAFIGDSIAPVLRRKLQREVTPVPTTRIVTDPGQVFVPGRSYAAVHFARSGDSPESIAAWRMIRAERPDAAHLVITCNAEGALAQEASRDSSSLVLLLPPEANDRSLAMTSSFTAMALCGIGLADLPGLARLRDSLGPVISAARRILDESSDALAGFAAASFSRACYLGSNALEGTMEEGALKMMEMTAGAVATVSNSFLGIRHGPRVFMNDECAIIACLATDPRARRYELDLLRDVRERRQGARLLGVCEREDVVARGLCDQLIVLTSGAEGVPDELRICTDVLVCQLLAFFASRARGLAPDSPSPSGVISRVVQGVTIYE